MATRKKAVEQTLSEHIKFGERTYVVSRIANVFWAICPELGDAFTRNAPTREDLISILTKDTGAEPKAVDPKSTRRVLVEDCSVKLYSDGVIDINTPYARIKVEAKYKTARTSKWQTTFDSLVGGEPMDSIDDLDDTDCFGILFTLTKVRYFHNNGVHEDVDYESKGLNSDGFFRPDGWVDPLVEHLHLQDPRTINPFVKYIDPENCEEYSEPKSAADERSLSRYILIMKAMLHLEQHHGMHWVDGLWCVQNFMGVEDFEDKINEIKRLARALEMV